MFPASPSRSPSSPSSLSGLFWLLPHSGVTHMAMERTVNESYEIQTSSVQWKKTSALLFFCVFFQMVRTEPALVSAQAKRRKPESFEFRVELWKE